MGSFCLSEPDAGSDAFGLKTTAKKDSNGDYILNGSKVKEMNDECEYEVYTPMQSLLICRLSQSQRVTESDPRPDLPVLKKLWICFRWFGSTRLG